MVEHIAAVVCEQIGAGPTRPHLIEHYDDRERLAHTRDRRSRQALERGHESSESFGPPVMA